MAHIRRFIFLEHFHKVLNYPRNEVLYININLSGFKDKNANFNFANILLKMNF